MCPPLGNLWIVNLVIYSAGFALFRVKNYQAGMQYNRQIMECKVTAAGAEAGKIKSHSRSPAMQSFKAAGAKGVHMRLMNIDLIP